MAIVEKNAGPFQVENVDDIHTDQYYYKKPKFTDAVFFFFFFFFFVVVAKIVFYNQILQFFAEKFFNR